MRHRCETCWTAVRERYVSTGELPGRPVGTSRARQTVRPKTKVAPGANTGEKQGGLFG